MPKGEEEFIDLDYNVEACMLDNYVSHADDYQLVECITKQVELKIPLDLALLVEFNLVESPTQQQMAWYFDLGAIHHVGGYLTVFALFHQTSDNNLWSANGQGHIVTSMGNVDFQFPDGVVKSISQVLYFPSIQKNLLSMGYL